MAGFDKRNHIRRQLEDDFSEIDSSAPPPIRVRSGVRPVPTPSPAAPVVVPPTVPSHIDLASPEGTVLLDGLAAPAAPAPPVDDLPGYATASGRRNVAILLTPEVNTLLEKAVPKGGTRGAVIVHALRIADAHLRARTTEPEVVDDPWADPDGQPYRRHLARPVRVTFTLSRNQGLALRDLAAACGEPNMSRLISDALEYAYGSRPIDADGGGVGGGVTEPSPARSRR